MNYFNLFPSMEACTATFITALPTPPIIRRDAHPSVRAAVHIKTAVLFPPTARSATSSALKMDPYAPTENCPICDIPFSSKLGRTEEERTAHVNACIESQIQASTGRNSHGDGKAKGADWNAPPDFSAAGSSSHPVYVPASTSSQRAPIELFVGQRAMLAAAQGEKKVDVFRGGETTPHENDRK